MLPFPRPVVALSLAAAAISAMAVCNPWMVGFLQPLIVASAPHQVAAGAAILGVTLLLVATAGFRHTPWQRGMRWAGVLAMLVIMGGAAIWDALRFGEMNSSTPFAIATRRAGSLAELVAHVPDRSPDAPQLLWLRRNVAGFTLVGDSRVLRRAGLVPHRVSGIAQVRVHFPPGDLRMAGGSDDPQAQGWIRIDDGAGSGKVWVDPAALTSARLLCAVPSRSGLLLLSPQRVEGCDR